MQQTADTTTLEEPVGIVISRGTRDEATPRFRAYVWSTESDGTDAEPTKHAA